MTHQELTHLVQQYAAGKITAQLAAELKDFLEHLDEKGISDELISEWLAQSQLTDQPPVNEPVIREHLQKIFAADKGLTYEGLTYDRAALRVHFMRKWGWAAAAVLLLTGLGVYFLAGKPGHTNIAQTAPAVIEPGKQGAILTLANGTLISLDSMQNGVVALQGGATAKVMNGTLIYEGNGTEIVYNKMSTPKGRQFHVTLPDGSDVWLNSGSSIRYPTLFTGQHRKVEITGEAYFEVATDAHMPFVVDVNNRGDIVVLGTRFNINAYENEATINTTLIEGAVRVEDKRSNAVVLQPGQQAQLKENGIHVIAEADLGKVIAWKNGLFNFENVSLEEVLRQLERWYDIEVIYEQGVPDIGLSGKMTRDIPLNTLLRVLKEMGLQYRIEDRKLIILASTKK